MMISDSGLLFWATLYMDIYKSYFATERIQHSTSKNAKAMAT